MSWIGVAVGAGAGLVKSAAVDAPREARQRKLAGETQRLSPWTGLKAGPIQEADPLGSALTYGSQGGALSGGIQNADAQKGLMEAQKNWLNRGGSPLYTAAQSQTSMPSFMAPTSPWSLGVNYPKF